ncbi:unnamed protein product [Linum trigynum]|uniref:Uncharacterized protein n=1 Tax=Linum trigynum TaxID=586398 RepID=A0AAV2G052_9ROSI
MLGSNPHSFSPEKQSVDTSLTVDEEEEDHESKAAKNVYEDVNGMNRERGEVVEHIDDARVVPVTQTEDPSSPEKQSRREVVSGGAPRSNPSQSKVIKILPSTSRISPIDQMEKIPSVLQNQNRAATPLETLLRDQNSSKVD